MGSYPSRVLSYDFFSSVSLYIYKIKNEVGCRDDTVQEGPVR